MARVPEEEIERLKKEISLERLVAARGIELTKTGANLVGLCPFHLDEKTPNLVVTPEKNVFHCFACNASGSRPVGAARARRRRVSRNAEGEPRCARVSEGARPRAPGDDRAFQARVRQPHARLSAAGRADQGRRRATVAARGDRRLPRDRARAPRWVAGNQLSAPPATGLRGADRRRCSRHKATIERVNTITNVLVLLWSPLVCRVMVTSLDDAASKSAAC